MVGVVYAYIGEEYRREDHISADNRFAVDERRIVQPRQHYTCDIRARYRRYAEKSFGGESVEETHAESENTRSALVREFAFFPFEIKSEQYPQPYGEREKSDRFKQRYKYLISAVAFKPRDYA